MAESQVILIHFIVSFDNPAAGLNLTEHTKLMWFPERKRQITVRLVSYFHLLYCFQHEYDECLCHIILNGILNLFQKT